jgi:hypothetical protein
MGAVQESQTTSRTLSAVEVFFLKKFSHVVRRPLAYLDTKLG